MKLNTTNALHRHQARGRTGDLLGTLDRIRDMAEGLPEAVDLATAAVRLAEKVSAQPSASAPHAHRTAVDSLKASARAGGTVDPAKAAQTLTKARAVDLTATTAAELAETALLELGDELLVICRRHGDELLASIRPRTMRLYDELQTAVGNLPIGVDIERPLDFGSAVASTLANIARITEDIAAFYAVRADLVASRVLPPLLTDKGGWFGVVRTMWRHERGPVIAGNARVAGLGIPLITPVLPPSGMAWWVHLARANAEWWAPSIIEQDLQCERYLTMRNSDMTIADAYAA